MQTLNQKNLDKQKSNQEYLDNSFNVEPNNSVLNKPIEAEYKHRQKVVGARKMSQAPPKLANDIESTIKLGFALEDAR